MSISAIGIIPARYESTRFPGKPLVIIGDKSMIRRVYEQASGCSSLVKVIIATDDSRIFEHVLSFGGEVMMTSKEHTSGTSRLAEVIEKLTLEHPELHFDVAVNIQGDEPFIDPEQINKVIALFENDKVQIATLIKQISDGTDIFNPNVVKVVVDHNFKALYFSRSAIPHARGEDQMNWVLNQSYFKHIGLYAYHADLVKILATLPVAEIETAESLEQLRWLYHGYSISAAITDIETIGIDTPDDLLKLTNIY